MTVIKVDGFIAGEMDHGVQTHSLTRKGDYVL